MYVFLYTSRIKYKYNKQLIIHIKKNSKFLKTLILICFLVFFLNYH